MKKYYSVVQSARSADVYIFGDITEWAWTELGEVSAVTFKNEISALDVDIINVHINSYGGSVPEGWAIYNTLREHKAKVVTFADGFVASAALYPFMAGEERIASNLSAFFLHQVMETVCGNADQLREAADEADKMNEIGLAAFTNAGIEADVVRDLEKTETWLSASEALEYGIATSIISDEAPRHEQSVKREIIKKITQKADAPSKTTEQEIKAREDEDVSQNKPERNLADLLYGLFK